MTPFDSPPLAGIDPLSRAVLERHRFDAGTFGELAAELRRSGVDGVDNSLQAAVEPPREGDIATLPAPGSAEAERLETAGHEAIRDGALAVAVLNGGMATRFGGVVKGIVEALDGRSFLELAATRIARAAADAGGRIPMLLMNSFATTEATAEHLERTSNLGLLDGALRCFSQSVFPRLTPQGDLFVGLDGRASLYGPGHGDFAGSIRDEGVLDWLEEQGVRHVALYNVDNLGACPDPAIVGQHVTSGRPMTVELVPKWEGDRGGAPARVGGHLEVVEAFRFPPTFDQDSIPVFNCNTFLFDLPALRRSFPLDWFTVVKQVNGRPAVQFERLVGQVTAFVDAGYLVVSRDGASSRFLPVKRPDDLDAVRPVLRQIFA